MASLTNKIALVTGASRESVALRHPHLLMPVRTSSFTMAARRRMRNLS